jgi:hypothetical protein
MFKAIAIVLLTLPVPVQALAESHLTCETATLDKTFRVDTGAKFIVDMNIDAGEVTVRQSGSADECRVSIEYSTAKFIPEIDFNSGKNRLDIVVDCHNLFKKGSCDGENKMELVIELPCEPPIDLNGELKAGEAEFRLGDLSIERFRFRSLAGETTVNFDEPNRIVCKRFELGTTIGETEIIRLGNSRFADAHINGGIGEMKIDFRVIALIDSRADIDLDLGETNIIVPENTGTKITVSRFLVFKNADCPCGFSRRGGSWYSDSYDTNAGRLAISLTPGVGELTIRHGKD